MTSIGPCSVSDDNDDDDDNDGGDDDDNDDDGAMMKTMKMTILQLVQESAVDLDSVSPSLGGFFSPILSR